MTRILAVCQEKGGSGKSLVARALAEAITGAPIIEIDSTRRLIELEDRVRFFPMRAERADIERSGGAAARAEFDPVTDAILSAEAPTILDVGANTSRALLSVLGDLQLLLEGAKIEVGVLVVVTADPGALAEAPRLLELAKPFSATFLLENRHQGAIDTSALRKIAGRTPISVLENIIMEDQAVQLMQGGGLVTIPKLDVSALGKAYGMSKAARILRDLTRLRAEAIEAIRVPATWLVEGA